MASKKIIITCAVTGGIHTPTMSEALPVTPQQIADQAVAAAEAGASILHLHARNPEDGRPTPDPAVFMRFLPVIKQQTDAVVNITTGGGLGMTLEERLAAALTAKPEMASLNMGSMNFGIYPMLDRYETWKHDWEPQMLEMTRDFIFKNTFKDIEFVLRELGEGCGTRFEFECYDVGHLYNLAHFVERGLVRPPFFVQTIFGILGGIGAEVDNLLHMRRTAQRLFGEDHEWSVLAAGRHQMPFATQAAMMGGNLRVGLEDSLYIAKGELAESNAQQVAKIRRIVEDLSFEVATPQEARERLALKGGDRVDLTMMLSGKVAVVTGGSKGIGRGIVERLSAEGAKVLAGSRGAPEAALTEGAEWVRLDVSNPGDVSALRQAVIERHGRLDVLVNNAGIQIEKSLVETTDEDWDRLMGTNAFGVFLCCRELIPLMRDGGGGAIVNIGSVSGFHADPTLALYNASKSFVHGLTRSIAVDHGAEGIRCNAVCPGWILTEMADQAFAQARDPEAAERDALARHAVGRMGKPRDIAATVAWLASDDAAFVTGQTFVVDGGLTAASPINPSLF